MWEINDVKICTDMIADTEDGSVYFDKNTNEIFIAGKKKWYKSVIFDQKEHNRQVLIEKRKEKLNKLNETR
jgi:hypothetical protein